MPETFYIEKSISNVGNWLADIAPAFETVAQAFERILAAEDRMLAKYRIVTSAHVAVFEVTLEHAREKACNGYCIQAFDFDRCEQWLFYDKDHCYSSLGAAFNKLFSLSLGEINRPIKFRIVASGTGEPMYTFRFWPTLWPHAIKFKE